MTQPLRAHAITKVLHKLRFDPMGNHVATETIALAYWELPGQLVMMCVIFEEIFHYCSYMYTYAVL